MASSIIFMRVIHNDKCLRTKLLEQKVFFFFIINIISNKDNSWIHIIWLVRCYSVNGLSVCLCFVWPFSKNSNQFQKCKIHTFYISILLRHGFLDPESGSASSAPLQLDDVLPPERNRGAERSDCAPTHARSHHRGSEWSFKAPSSPRLGCGGTHAERRRSKNNRIIKILQSGPDVPTSAPEHVYLSGIALLRTIGGCTFGRTPVARLMVYSVDFFFFGWNRLFCRDDGETCVCDLDAAGSVFAGGGCAGSRTWRR